MGKEVAYVINDRLAWVQARDQLWPSVFSAAAMADYDDQEEALLGHGDLRRAVFQLYLPVNVSFPPALATILLVNPAPPVWMPDLSAWLEQTELEQHGQHQQTSQAFK